MAVNRIFGAISLSQGTGSLSNISSTLLVDKDMAIARGNSNLGSGGHDAEFDGIYFYRWEASRTDTHNEPYVIKPDNLSVGNSGRWLLISPTHFMENIIVDPNAKIITNKVFGNGSGLTLGFDDDGPVTALTIDAGGTGFVDGSYPGEPTSGGTGTGLTVDVTVSGGVVTGVVVATGGDDYVKGDAITLDNFAGVALTVSSVNNLSILILETEIQINYDTRFFGRPSFEVSSGAAFSVNGNQTLIDDLNAEYHGGQLISNISLLDDNTNKYSVLPQVTDATLVYPSVDADLITYKYFNDVISDGSAIDHGTLSGLADDDHTQYMLVTGNRAGVGFTGVVSGQTPTLAAHLSTKGYVDTAIAGLGLGAAGSYLLRDGTNTATAPILYDVAVTFAVLDAGSAQKFASVDYVKQSLTNHTSSGDPHAYYLRNDGDDLTSGRLSTTVLNTVAQGNYVPRAEIDTLFVSAYTNLSSSDTFTTIGGTPYTSNIVRRDIPKANRDIYKAYILESADDNLTTYAYLAARLINLFEFTDALTVGQVKEISIFAAGTGYTDGSYVGVVPTGGSGSGLTIDITVSGGSITSATINAEGQDYLKDEVLSVPGGTGGTIQLDEVIVGAIHGNLFNMDADDHPQYILADSTRVFDNTAGEYPSVANAAFDPFADHHLATKKYVDDSIGVSGTVSDVNNLNGSVDIYNDLGAISTYPESPSSGLGPGATTLSANTRFYQIPRLSDTAFPSHTVSPAADYTNDYELASKAYVDYAVAGGIVVQGVVTTDGANPLLNNQIYVPKYPLDYFLENQDGLLDSQNVVDKDYVDTYMGRSLISDSDEYAGYLYESFAETSWTGTLDTTINTGATTGVVIEQRSLLKGEVSRVEIVDGGSGFFVIDATSGSFPQTISAFDHNGVNTSYTETSVQLDESGNTTSDIRPTKLIGDVGIVQIVNGGTGYPASTSFDVYFSGDGVGAVWSATTDGAGTIVSIQRSSAATTPYTYISAITISEDNGVGTDAVLNAYVVGEIVEFYHYAYGTGYTGASWRYAPGSAVDDGFTWAGHGTTTGDTNDVGIDITFLNALDEKLQLNHYTPAGVPSSPFNVTSGYTISQIQFDSFGHVVGVSEVGQSGMPWAKWVSGDLVFNTAYFVDTTGGTVTLDMSASPAIGHTVVIDDYQKNSTTNNITVRANGGATLLVEGVSSNLVIDVDGARVLMTYVDGTYGWRYKVI